MSFDAQILNETIQRKLARLIHHSSSSREELCKQLVAEVHTSDASHSPPIDRPPSADKENQASRRRGKSKLGSQESDVVDFLAYAANYDLKSQLWEVKPELRQMWGVPDRIHPFFTSPKASPANESPMEGRRKSRPGGSGDEKKRAPLVPYTPSSIGSQSPLTDEEELMLKRHGFAKSYGESDGLLLLMLSLGLFTKIDPASLFQF